MSLQQCYRNVYIRAFLLFCLFFIVRQFDYDLFLQFRVKQVTLVYDNIELNLTKNEVKNITRGQWETSLKEVTKATNVSIHNKKNKKEASSSRSSSSSSLQISSSSLPSSSFVKLPTPIFVVGMPKSGTTTIYNTFKCAGLNAMHYCCCGATTDHFPCKGGSPVGKVMRANLKHNRSILHNVGPYDVWGQMDSEVTVKFNNKPKMSLFLPQHYHLNELHESYPNATFILNLRPKQDWARSVKNWYNLGHRFRFMYYYHDHQKTKRIHQGKFLMDFYTNHTKRVEEFVQSHPSHKLIKVNITDPTAGEKLSDAFGIPAKCWGHYNHRSNGKNKKTKKQQPKQQQPKPRPKQYRQIESDKPQTKQKGEKNSKKNQKQIMNVKKNKNKNKKEMKNSQGNNNKKTKTQIVTQQDTVSTL